MKKGLLSRFLPQVELGPYFIVFSLIAFVVLITVITLIFSTRQVTKGYVLNSLESQNGDLVKQSEIMDMQISKVRSLNFIQDSAKVDSMRKPYEVVFVNGNTVVASK